MVRMGLRAASPTAAASDDDGGDDAGGDGQRTAERTGGDRQRTCRSGGRRRHVGYHHAAHSSRRFDSMQEIAGNLAAGVQRIGFQCALPWTRSRRRRAAAERSAAVGASHHTVDGSTMTEEEQRARACQQILQLTEQQIVGKNSALYDCFLRRVISPSECRRLLSASLVNKHDSTMWLMVQTIALLGGNDIAVGY